MSSVTIEKRKFENDKGEVVNYNVICIRGTINGSEQKLEKSISNVEAMLGGMLLASDENLSVVSGSSKGVDIPVTRKSGKSKEQEIDELLDL